MGNQLPVPRMENTFNLKTRSLLDFPLETTLDISSYLDKNDIKALRSTCRRMDILLLDTFGKQFFNSLYVMPTVFALDTLVQISENQRIRYQIKELHICCSIYQDRGGNPDAYSSPRWLREDELPFEDPDTPVEKATNDSVTLVRKGGFEAQLIIALRNLDITQIKMHTYRSGAPSEALRLGNSQLIRQTDRDPSKAITPWICRAWEYDSHSADGPADMSTFMTSTVLSALEKSKTPITTLTIPIVQIDKLKISHTSGAKLTSLQDLRITIGPSNRHEHSSSPPDLSVMINTLPNLRTLDLNTYPSERLNAQSLPLYPFLANLAPLQLETLHLRSLSDTSALLAPFLSSLPRLHTLSLHFIPVRERKNKPWKQMFLSLKPALSKPNLRNLEMQVDGSDAFELAATRLRRRTYEIQGLEGEDWWYSDDEEDESDEEEYWYESNGYQRKEKDSIMPTRDQMLDRLAEIMPHYHRQVFRTCGIYRQNGLY